MKILNLRICNFSQFDPCMSGWQRKRKGSCPELFPAQWHKSLNIPDLSCVPRTQTSTFSSLHMSLGFLATIFPQNGFGRRSLLTSYLLFKSVFPTFVMDTGNICMAHWHPQTRCLPQVWRDLCLCILVAFWCAHRHTGGEDYSRSYRCHNFFLFF